MPQGHQRAMAHRRRAILRHGRPLFSQKSPKASIVGEEFSWLLVGLSLSTPCIAAQELLDSFLGIIRANWHDPEKTSVQRLYFLGILCPVHLKCCNFQEFCALRT